MSSAEDMRVAASNDSGTAHDATSVHEFEELVEDYIVEIPELEGLLPFESRDVGKMEFSDMHTAHPIMKLGPCTFQGEFLPIIGTSLVIAPPAVDAPKMDSTMDDETAGSKRPRASMSSAAPGADDGEDDEEMTYDSPHGAPSSEVNTYKIVALTSKRIVFKLVPGKGSIADLMKVKSAK